MSPAGGTMKGTFRPTINLGNSVIGVSILAMPYCLKSCGVLLGVLLLILSAFLTTWSCNMLVKAAWVVRRMSYESLAQTAFGKQGKLCVELSIIGLNIGACIAFFVIIGDLAPPIVATTTGVQWSPGFLRAFTLVVLAVCVALPLALLRNVDNLSAISMASLAFYSALIIQLLFLSLSNFSSGAWWSNLILWKWDGILKCLPIFSLAFACHPQLFVIYSALAEPSVRKMSTVVTGAVAMVASGYCMIAIFGYVSFCTDNIKGDILANFSTSTISQLFRFGFALSVVLSFPLLIFPCRASINSLFFSKASMELHVSEPIPQQRWVAITTSIIATTLTVAILIPKVETVLALTGATMGSCISYIFPGFFFLRVASSGLKQTEYSIGSWRNKAKLVLGIGLGIMVLSTAVILVSDMNGEPTFEERTPFRIKVQEGSKQVPMRHAHDYHIDLPNDMEDLDPTQEVGRLEPVEPVEPVEQAGEEGEKREDEEGGGGEKEHGEEIHQKISDQISEIKERLDQVVEENKLLKEKQDELEKKQQQEQKEGEGGRPEEGEGERPEETNEEQLREPVKEAPEEEGEIVPEHREVAEGAAPTDDVIAVEGGEVPDGVIDGPKEVELEEIESPKKDDDDRGIVAENMEVEGNIQPGGGDRKESTAGKEAGEILSDAGDKQVVEKREVKEVDGEFIPEVEQLSDVQDGLPEGGVAAEGVAEGVAEPSKGRHFGRDLKNADGAGQAVGADHI